MPAGLRVFGLVHLAILASIPGGAAFLSLVQRRYGRAGIWIRGGLAALLLASTVSYYGYFAAQGGGMFPEHVPLELCDASLWLVIAALLTLNAAVFDVVYYWAVAGASMSLLTPDMVNPTRFLALQYFVDHGLLVGAVLYLVWTGQARPRAGSVARSRVALNVFAAIAGTFDAVYETNYMFLRRKPPTASLLDAMGPWPWYIAAGEVLACGLFLLLYWPFWRSGVGAEAGVLDGVAAEAQTLE